MAKAVEKRLSDEGNATSGELLWSHQLVHGGESNAGVHAGLASALGHLEQQGESNGVLVARVESNDGSGKLLWAGPLLAMLARRVFLEFGVSVEDLDKAAEPIQRLALDLNEHFRSGPS